MKDFWDLCLHISPKWDVAPIMYFNTKVEDVGKSMLFSTMICTWKEKAEHESQHLQLTIKTLLLAAKAPSIKFKYFGKRNNLQDKKITEVPDRHEALFTEFAYLILIKLNTPIQCISDWLHNLRFQVFPKICFRAVYI